MSPTPPDLRRPYGSAQERAADRDNLIAYWYALESLINLAKLFRKDWSPSQAALLREFSRGGTDQQAEGESQAERLQRWATLYSDELDIVRDVRNRIVHGDLVTDPELLGATWLARQVLATVAGVSPTLVDQAWARSVAAQAAK